MSERASFFGFPGANAGKACNKDDGKMRIHESEGLVSRLFSSAASLQSHLVTRARHFFYRSARFYETSPFQAAVRLAIEHTFYVRAVCGGSGGSECKVLFVSIVSQFPMPVARAIKICEYGKTMQRAMAAEYSEHGRGRRPVRPRANVTPRLNPVNSCTID